MSDDNNFKLDDFIRRVQKSFSSAWKDIQIIEHFDEIQSEADFSAGYHEQNLASSVDRVFLELRFALEALEYPQLLADLKDGFKQYQGKQSEVKFDKHHYELTCPALDFLLDYFQIVCSLGPDSAEFDIQRQLRQLESILYGTSKIVFDKGLTPSNESEIRKAVYDVLIHIFPDTVREVPIAKVAKTYKPDIGIRSLKAAVEYKFADSEKDLKACIGGILEDVGGYANSLDWTNFFAVIYMTNAFMTPAQIHEEFRAANVGPSWKIIPLSGGGNRKKSKTR